MTTLAWPIAALAPRDVAWRLDGRVISGPPSLTGLAQVSNTTGGGFWTCTFADIPVGGPGPIRAARALEAVLDGGVTAIIVPMRDLARAPGSLGGNWEMGDPLAHSDGAFFSDGSGYEQGGASDGALTIEAGLRATEIQLRISGGEIFGGEHFSADHNTAGRRLYRIARITADFGGGVYAVEIRPPLREALPAEAHLDFARPSCVMRLADPRSIQLGLELNRVGKISPTFVEEEVP